MASLDLLIRGGTIVDGTGVPRHAGDVGVSGDRLRIIATGEQIVAAREIDATGKVVAPGFIDLHSHSGLMILAEPRHEPKVRQGVTTEIIGVDGLSYAPIPSSKDLDALIEMNAGLDGRPEGLQPTGPQLANTSPGLTATCRAQRRADGRQQRAANLAPWLAERPGR